MKIHVGKSSNGSVQAIFHIDVPSGTNRAGLSWPYCVMMCGDYPPVTKALQQDDLPKIKLGEIIEWVECFTFSDKNLTDEQKKAELEARYTVVAPEVIDKMQKKLKYFGYEDNP